MNASAPRASRIVAVTGATAGVGLGVAREFAAAGHHVVGSARDGARGHAIERRLRAEGLDFDFVEADVSTAAACRRFIDSVTTAHGGLDVLVNNAGTVGATPHATLGEYDEHQFDELVNTNLRSMFFTTQHAAAAMARCGGGVIFNLGSLAGETVSRELLLYRTTKAATMFMSQCLAEALRPAGIIVHTIVVHRVASDGGRRTLEARIARDSLNERDAGRLRDDYAARAVDPDDFGRSLVEMLDHPDITIGPGFTVRR